MAAAVFPLILGALPSIINFIAALVHQGAPIMETTHGPGTGPVKFADLFTFVVDALQKAAAAGTIDKTLPGDDLIKAIIQAVVTSMQMSGTLGGAPITPSNIQTIQGATLKIVGGTIQFQS